MSHDPNLDSLYLTGINLGESFSVTALLRWVDNSEHGKCQMTPKLQQLWQGSRGSQRWEDVPTVKESE